jgi:hypothetical protein
LFMCRFKPLNGKTSVLSSGRRSIESYSREYIIMIVTAFLFLRQDSKYINNLFDISLSIQQTEIGEFVK